MDSSTPGIGVDEQEFSDVCHNAVADEHTSQRRSYALEEYWGACETMRGHARATGLSWEGLGKRGCRHVLRL